MGHDYHRDIAKPLVRLEIEEKLTIWACTDTSRAAAGGASGRLERSREGRRCRDGEKPTELGTSALLDNASRVH